jgi:hypothetical protein
MQGFPGAGHSKVAVTNPSEGDESICQFLDFSGFSSHYDDLKAVIVVHMDMGGGNNMVMVVVLHQGYFLLQLVLVMVVDQADHAHDLFVGLPFLFDKGFTDQIPDCFGSIAVTAGFNVFIENIEQFFLK